jgi:HEPN domain-containing protein
MTGGWALALPRKWLRYAEDDLDAARRDLGDGTAPRISCFNAQQATEKIIKAVLEQLGTSYLRTHDLTVLEALLPQRLQSSMSGLNLGQLTRWAVDSRYPDFASTVTEADAKESVRIAEAVFAILTPEIL